MMSLIADALECPNCGAAISVQDRVCGYCHTEIIIRRIHDAGEKSPNELNKYIQLYKNTLQSNQGDGVETRTALGICLLKKGAYNEARSHLEKAVSMYPDNGESHYYLSLSMMQKKRPYMHTLRDIKQMVEYMETALTYETCGKYYYLLYLIQTDFYDKKRIRNGKNAEELMSNAIANELDDQDTIECNEYCGM